MNCKHGVESEIISGKGWMQAVVCTNPDMPLKFGTQNICPFISNQEECSHYDTVQPRKVPIREIHTCPVCGAEYED